MPGIVEKFKYHHLPYMLEENILVLEAYATHFARFLQQQSMFPYRNAQQTEKSKNWKKKHFQN
jgi:hypothetical protein